MSSQGRESALAGEELFRGVFEHSPVGMAVMDESGVILEANASLARILGYDAPAEIAGLRMSSLTHPDEAPKDVTAITEMLDGHPSYSAEKRYVRNDGSVCHTRISSTMVRVRHTDSIRFVMQVQDVTEAKLAESELQRLADAAELGSDAIISVDLDRRIRHWNRGAERVLGYSAEEMIGMRVEELLEQSHEPVASRADSFDVMSSAFEGRIGSARESARHHKDGTPKTLSVAAAPWRVDGEIVGATGILVDMTERKQAEQVTARLAAIVNGSDDAIIGKTLEGVITSWNPSAERIYGYTAVEAVGQHISILAPAGLEAEIERILATIRTGAVVRHLETSRRRKDGRVIDVSITVSPIRDAGGEIVGGATVARDITEHKQAERAREQTLRDLDQAQRIARLGSWTWDSIRDEATWSGQMYEIFGRDPAAGAATSDELFAYIHSDDRERMASDYARAFGRGSGFELSYRIVLADGHERYLRGLGYEDPAQAGRYVGTVQDVTDQRQAEQERIGMLEATVRAEGANRAKSEFLARMSHELRTPLNSIMGFSQLMQLEGGEPRQQKHVSLVLKAARHLLGLINDVLDIATIEAGQLAVSLEAVAIAEAIRGAVEMLEPTAAESSITVELDLTGIADDAHVIADSNRLRQVLLNLLSNAIKYNQAGGRVHTKAVTTPAGRVRISLTDTGIGIEESELPKLFEPFERLGAEQTDIEGTGLGLSLSRALLEAMGGTIEAESEPGSGSTFSVELRLAERPEAGQGWQLEHARSRVLSPSSSARRILYVEDNLSNLTLVEEILGEYPEIELLSAMQGLLGLELARLQEPDLIILDLHLPDISGIDVLKRLKRDEVTRHIPVVVLTADMSKTESERAHRLGANDYLTKPLDVIAFVDVVSAHLAPAPDGD